MDVHICITGVINMKSVNFARFLLVVKLVHTSICVRVVADSIFLWASKTDTKYDRIFQLRENYIGQTNLEFFNYSSVRGSYSCKICFADCPRLEPSDGKCKKINFTIEYKAKPLISQYAS